MFFKELIDKKKDKVEFDIIPKTNEEYISVTYRCIRFIDSFRFLSSRLDSLVKTLVDNSHKTLKDLEGEFVDNDQILNTVNEIKILIKKYQYKNDSIKDLKKDYPDEIKNLEETLPNYIGENDLKLLKTEFPDKWEFLTKKMACPYEIFNCIEGYQKPVDNLKKEVFFGKLKYKCPYDEEIERTKEIIEVFDNKNGEELTQIYLKSDVLLLTCVFEKLIKVSINELDINPLFCVSLPGYTWQCGLKYTEIILQTLQDKDLILTLENNIRGGISIVMGDHYVKSDENKKILYMDATILYGNSMIQPLPYDEIEMWHGHPDLYVNKLDEILSTLDDSDIGFFVEVDLRYPDDIKEKTKCFPFAPENNVIPEDKYNDYMKQIKPMKYTKSKKLICDWTDKKIYLVHYRMLKFYIRHGMVIEKIHEIISFKQSKWLEKFMFQYTKGN